MPLSSREPIAVGGEVARLLRGAWRSRPDPDAGSGGPSDEARALLLRSGGGALGWHALGRPRDGVAEPLRQAYRLHALQAAVHERAVAFAFRRLRARRVEPILGKGWAAALLYPEPGLRPYGDVDLYFDPTGHDRLLRDAPDEPAGVAADRHRGASFLDDRPWDALSGRSRLLPLRGQRVRVFSAEDHLRLLALHLLASGAWRPLWLCDVAAAVEAGGEDFDWTVAMEGDRRRTEAVGVAIAAAGAILSASLDGVPSALRPSLPGWLVPAILRQWGRSDFVPHGQRVAFSRTPRRPAAVLRALVRRWPDPVEATIAIGAPFDERPRLPYQVACCARRLRRAWRALRPPGTPAAHRAGLGTGSRCSTPGDRTWTGPTVPVRAAGAPRPRTG